MSDTSIWSANGAPLSARMAREQLFLSSGGQTGIVHPDSLEVVAQGTPDNTVIIQPGTFVAVATPPGAAVGYTTAPWQSYGRSIYDPQVVEIDPTTSSGGRTDVVGILIEDPEFDGTYDAEDYTDEELRDILMEHRYWRPYVARNVGTSATRPEHFASLRKPFVPLAQINIPRSTGTIENSMITDIRFMAVHRTETNDLISPSGAFENTMNIRPTDTSWQTVYEFDNIQIPQWATGSKIYMRLGPVYVINDAANGEFRLRVSRDGGASVSAAHAWVEPDPTAVPGGSPRFYMEAAARMAIPRSVAGGANKIELQVRRIHPSGGSRNGTLVIPGNHLWVVRASGRVTYEEAPLRTQGS